MIIFLVAMIAIFYFLIIRPQSKRRKEQQALMAGLGVGDEVVTVGGIMGEISAVDENYAHVKVAERTTLKFQKAAISSTLPKGTLKGTTRSQVGELII